MYGNVFRRASNAIIFLRQISNISKENSPSGSRLTVNDLEDSVFQNNRSSTEEILPQVNEPVNNLKLPNLFTRTTTFDQDSAENTRSRKKKKKKSKKKHKESESSLQVPEIKITT